MPSPSLEAWLQKTHKVMQCKIVLVLGEMEKGPRLRDESYIRCLTRLTAVVMLMRLGGGELPSLPTSII